MPEIVNVTETTVQVLVDDQITTLVLGETGPQGPRGTQLLNGLGEPTSSVGIDGDFYLDTVLTELYGPKTNGTWGTGISLRQAELGYVHTQTVASATWTVNHNLEFVPNITVVDTGENVIEGSYEYPSATQVILRFSSPFSGKAYLS